MLRLISTLCVETLLGLYVFTFNLEMCSAQAEHGSAESRRRLDDYIRDRARADQQAEDRQTAAEEVRREWTSRVEAGKKLFGAYARLDEAKNVRDPLSGKGPADYRVGDWGFIRVVLKAVNRIDTKAYLVTCDDSNHTVLSPSVVSTYLKVTLTGWICCLSTARNSDNVFLWNRIGISKDRSGRRVKRRSGWKGYRVALRSGSQRKTGAY